MVYRKQAQRILINQPNSQILINQEKADHVHPVLSKTLDNIGDYDTVFLGYPKMEV